MHSIARLMPGYPGCMLRNFSVVSCVSAMLDDINLNVLNSILSPYSITNFIKGVFYAGVI